MRKFLGVVAAFAGLQALIAAAILWTWAVDDPPAAYHTGSRIKTRRLREAPSPRIIFVGGSSTAFGIDSPLVEERLGRACVNMGSYVWLGLEYILAETESGLRSGDVVVVAPELTLFSLPVSRKAMIQVLRENPRAFRLPSWRDKKWFLDHGHGEIGAEVRNLLRDAWFTGDERRGGDSFSVQGDFNTPATYAPMASIPPYELPDPESALFQDRLELLNRFTERQKAKGVHVWFAYPPLERENVRRQAAALSALVAVLERKLRAPRLVGLEDMVFPAELFFDSNYHLNREGRTLRTRILIERLSAALR